MKRDLSDVAQEEASLLAVLGIESVLKVDNWLLSSDKAYNRLAFRSSVQKWLGMNNSSDSSRN